MIINDILAWAGEKGKHMYGRSQCLKLIVNHAITIILVWFIICDYSRMKYHMRLFAYKLSYVNILIWFSICDYSRMIQHMRLFSYDSSYAIISVWFITCDYSRMIHHMRLFAYDSLQAILPVWFIIWTDWNHACYFSVDRLTSCMLL